VSLSSALEIALLGLFKVNDVPDRFEVVDLDVQVLEVESVLPDVDTDDGDVSEERVLVRRRRDLKTLRRGVETEPSPARALNSSGARVERLLERIDGSELLLDGRLEWSITELAPGALALGRRRREVLPEEGVVDMASTVELERSLKSDALLRGRCLRVGLLCGVESIYIRLVVLLVVKLHDLTGDEGLETIVGIREVGESVLSGHCFTLC